MVSRAFVFPSFLLALLSSFGFWCFGEKLGCVYDGFASAAASREL